MVAFRSGQTDRSDGDVDVLGLLRLDVVNLQVADLKDLAGDLVHAVVTSESIFVVVKDHFDENCELFELLQFLFELLISVDIKDDIERLGSTLILVNISISIRKPKLITVVKSFQVYQSVPF